MLKSNGFFDHIFRKAVENSVLVMNTEGIILEVNRGFLLAFGYFKKDVIGKNFAILFTEKDKEANIPEIEIKTALKKGSKSDNNYLVHKDGTYLWVLGESVSVENEAGEKYIVKIIQNINTQKKLEGFLVESNEFINTIFDSVKDAAFVMLNSELRILRSNKMFFKIFGLKKTELSGIKLAAVEHPFFRSADIKKQIANVIVTKTSMKNVPFSFTNDKGKLVEIDITSKLMENDGMGRTILIIIRPK